MNSGSWGFADTDNIPSPPSLELVTLHARNKTLGMWTMPSSSMETPAQTTGTERTSYAKPSSEPLLPTPPGFLPSDTLYRATTKQWRNTVAPFHTATSRRFRVNHMTVVVKLILGMHIIIRKKLAMQHSKLAESRNKKTEGVCRYRLSSVWNLRSGKTSKCNRELLVGLLGSKSGLVFECRRPTGGFGRLGSCG